jgi:hypothetical protein
MTTAIVIVLVVFGLRLANLVSAEAAIATLSGITGYRRPTNGRERTKARHRCADPPGGDPAGRVFDGEMRLGPHDHQLVIQFEASTIDPRNSWLALRYVISDYWTGEQHEIDDRVRLVATRPPFGGQRWWFVCPAEGRRVRKLYLPLGRHRFRSRHAYRLAYASQREAVHDRAMRRARKLRRRLGGDPADGGYPEKPPWMRQVTYYKLLDKLAAAERIVDRVADERLILAARRLGGGP